MKKMSIYLTFVLILIGGVCCSFFGIKGVSEEKNFKKEAIEIDAKIYQNVTTGNKQVLYIRYLVNGEQYDGVVSSYNKKKYNGSIKIYYDKNNPLKYTTGDIKYEGYLLIFLGVVLVITSCSFIIRMFLGEN